MFDLDKRLANSCFFVADGPLSVLLLSKNALYPWLILVPRIEAARDLIDLTEAQQHTFLQESNAVSRWLMQRYRPDKLNVAALGNVVAQLHVHHVARFEHDPSWPAPIWGHNHSAEYTVEAVAEITAELAFFASDLFA